jgi:hypothetical protein
MNSFAEVEWLPEPGLTPDQPLYVLDTFHEAVMLAVAALRAKELPLALDYAREKLAETAQMIRDQKIEPANSAAAHYAAYLERAAQALAETPAAALNAQRERYVQAVLEHVYIMSVEYVDFPLGMRRTVLGPLFASAMAQFDAQHAALPEAARQAFFFKLEEIRWSLEMTVQADAQNITNEY